MRLKIIYIYTSLLLTLFCVSCDNSLSTVPDERTEIDSAEKVGELLAAAYPTSLYAGWLEPRTDNADDKTREATEHRYNTKAYFWEDTFEDSRDYPTHYWNHAFEAIAQANQALESIEELGEGKELNAHKGEALLARAYSYFMLVNIWGENYDPQTADANLGLPYLEEPEKNLLAYYERESLKGNYEKIEQDLVEGLELVGNDYDSPKYHFTKEAAYAFAARFYLYKGEWDKVIEYGEKVFKNGVTRLRDWTGTYASMTREEIQNQYGHAEEPSNLLIVSASSKMRRHMSHSRYQLSVSLLDGLFHNNNPTGKQWSYRTFGNDTHKNLPIYVEYFKYSNPSAGTGYPFTNGVLFSRDEVLFNLAEAYAMVGDLERATYLINQFLSTKTSDFDESEDLLTVDDIQNFYQVDADIYTPFYEISSESLPFVHAVAELRRREFYNQGLRWFDIKRFHLKIIHTTSDGEVFTLEKDDLRRALQIPHEAVDFGLEENPR